MRYLFSFLFALGTLSLYAKDGGPRLEGKPRIDSLKARLTTAKEDFSKVSLLGLLSFEYRTINPDTGILYAGQALELAKDISSKQGMAIGYGNTGLNYKFKADYPKALENLFKALELNEEAGFKLGIGSNFSNIGVVYQEQGNFTKALEFLEKSFKINEQIKDSSNMAGDLGNIGIIYNVGKANYAQALDYELKSLRIFESLNDKEGIAHNLGNIGDVYYRKGDLGKALEYDLKALAMFEELGDKSSIAINLGNIGETYFSMAKSTGNDAAQRSIGPSPQLKSAIEYLTKSLVVSREIGDLESIIEFSQYLSEANQLSGNYVDALNSYKEYAAMRDSVYSTDSKLKIAKLEAQRDLQVNQLDVAKKRNERIFLIVVTILLLIIIGIGLKKYLEQRKSNRQLSKEKKKHLARIEAQTSVLNHIAHTQSHEVSGQVATILGLVQVFNFEDTADPDNKVVIEGIAEVSHKLDKIVKEMITRENNLDKTSAS